LPFFSLPHVQSPPAKRRAYYFIEFSYKPKELFFHLLKIQNKKNLTKCEILVLQFIVLTIKIIS
jgi:hypothetical protein